MLVCAAGLEHTPHFSTFGRCQLRRDAHQPRGPVPPVRPRARPLAWGMGLPGGAHCPPSWELSPENFLEARNGFLSVARSPAPLPTRAVHSSPGYAHAHRRSRPRVFVAGQTFPLSAPPGLNARFILATYRSPLFPLFFQSVWATTSLSYPRSQVRTFHAVCRAARPMMVARARPPARCKPRWLGSGGIHN